MQSESESSGVNSILINTFPFCLVASFCLVVHRLVVLRELLSKTFFVKSGPEILHLFLAEKLSFVVCLFCCITLSDFGKALIELRKMLLRKKL